jgi:hypothetical protein
LSGNTLVPTENGIRRIKDITTQDRVLTHTGRYQKVIDTQKVYSNDLVKVVTSTGKVLTMTPDHKLLVMLPRTNKKLNTEYEWREASELSVGDYLVANKSECIETEEKIVSIGYLVVNNHPMYDITVEKDHSFIANGLISHNCMGSDKFRTYAKIAYGVSMTLEEAQANRKLYFTSYPGLQVYHNTFASKDTNVAYSLPPFNRPRYFDRYPGIPALANHPVQSTSADIQKLAQAMMFEDLHSKGFSPVGSHKMRQLVTIHDEIVSEATDEYVEECKHIQQKAMEDAAKVVLSLCPVEAEADCIINLALKG